MSDLFSFIVSKIWYEHGTILIRSEFHTLFQHINTFKFRQQLENFKILKSNGSSIVRERKL